MLSDTINTQCSNDNFSKYRLDCRQREEIYMNKLSYFHINLSLCVEFIPCNCGTTTVYYEEKTNFRECDAL